MRLESYKLLWDIADCSTFILDATTDLDQRAYQVNRTVRQAVERNVEIIDESLNQLSRVDPEVAERIDGYRGVIALRHRLAHGYRDIDDSRMWTYVKTLLPDLNVQVVGLLREAGYDFEQQN
jgi:uncharacterized protein with HEPN domain